MGVTSSRCCADDAVTGDWYGTDGAGGAKAKITKAACQVMKLGESVLWVHTSYPTRF